MNETVVKETVKQKRRIQLAATVATKTTELTGCVWETTEGYEIDQVKVNWEGNCRHLISPPIEFTLKLNKSFSSRLHSNYSYFIGRLR